MGTHTRRIKGTGNSTIFYSIVSQLGTLVMPPQLLPSPNFGGLPEAQCLPCSGVPDTAGMNTGAHTRLIEGMGKSTIFSSAKLKDLVAGAFVRRHRPGRRPPPHPRGRGRHARHTPGPCLPRGGRRGRQSGGQSHGSCRDEWCCQQDQGGSGGCTRPV